MYIKQLRYNSSFLQNWHSRLSERSYFTRIFFLMPITSVTGNTPNSVSHSCTTSFDFTFNIFKTSIDDVLKGEFECKIALKYYHITWYEIFYA